MPVWVWLLLIAFQVFNVALILFSVYVISKVYSKRIQVFAEVVRDAMTLRDAKLRELEARFARAINMDADLFDHMLDDKSDIVPGGEE